MHRRVAAERGHHPAVRKSERGWGLLLRLDALATLHAGDHRQRSQAWCPLVMFPAVQPTRSGRGISFEARDDRQRGLVSAVDRRRENRKLRLVNAYLAAAMP